MWIPYSILCNIWNTGDIRTGKRKHDPLKVSDLAAVKYTGEFWIKVNEKGTFSIYYTPDSLSCISEKGHEVKYVAEEKFNSAMS